MTEEGEQACVDWHAAFELEPQMAALLSGIKRASDLRRIQAVLTGRTKAWADQLAYRRAAIASSHARSL